MCSYWEGFVASPQWGFPARHGATQARWMVEISWKIRNKNGWFGVLMIVWWIVHGIFMILNGCLMDFHRLLMDLNNLFEILMDSFMNWFWWMLINNQQLNGNIILVIFPRSRWRDTIQQGSLAPWRCESLGTTQGTTIDQCDQWLVTWENVRTFDDLRSTWGFETWGYPQITPF